MDGTYLRVCEAKQIAQKQTEECGTHTMFVRVV